jgi:hypothetical protein
MGALSSLWHCITGCLFPALEEELDPLTEKEREFVTVCEMAQLDRQMGPYRWRGKGRKRNPRVDLAKAFVAKAVYNFPTTDVLVQMLRSNKTLRRLCGWEWAMQVPSESTFSRAFAEFARGDLGNAVHEAMVKTRYGNKLAGHISRDATAIKAREKAAKKTKAAAPKPKRRRGRPRKGEERREPKPERRLVKQGTRALAENLADLPKICDWGAKRNSQGKLEIWKGYKLHLDVADGDIPIAAILTSASVHDSQVAIPLAQMSAQRVTNCYDLMDAAYAADEIVTFSRGLGHVPIIDWPERGGVKPEMDPATARRYDQRTASERVNSTVKDNYGGRHVRVRGDAKVKLHLMFGLIAVCALQLIRLLE